MKFHKLVLSVTVVAFGFMLYRSAFSDDKKAPRQSQEEMMAVYAKYATPGPQHKYLEQLVGSWDCTAKMWQDPSAQPTESKASCETKWILGGRFIQDEVSGDMNGMPFHGMGVTGFDNVKQEYVAFWIDEMATSFMLTAGKSDSAGKVFTMFGSYTDPLSNIQEKKFKTVTTVVDNDTHTYAMYQAGPDGKDFKSFEITYTRK